MCRLSALSVSRRLEACKHRIHTLHGTRAHRTREAAPRTRTAGPARSAAEYTGQVPPEEGGAHHTPRVPPREGRGSLLGGSGLEQPLHASAHYGAPRRGSLLRAAAACKCSLRRPDHRTCAPSACKCSPRRQAPPQNLRALPRASSSTSCGHRRRSVASSRSHVPRAPDERQSDAIRCNQMQSDALRGTQRQSRSHVPRAPDERQSEAIRSHQRQSEAIRSHQRQSEAIQSAPLTLSDRTEP